MESDAGEDRPSPEDVEAEQEATTLSFPIVGIGASAGGLDAVTRLLRAVPDSPGMAFILVQHLDPKHASGLVALLARVTAMDVCEATDEMPVEVDRVYVIPPNAAMFLRQGRLHVTPRATTPEPLRLIDQFLHSLAEEHVAQVFGVILSGIGSDGTRGLEAIKAAGGVTFAQDATAAHDGMPLSAVAAGCVDFVLPPEEIVRELMQVRAPRPVLDESAGSEEGSSSKSEAEARTTLLRLLRAASGVDFTHYKQPTLRRRIERRMFVNGKVRLEDYVALLKENPSEVQALYEDILIHVTSFFRDPESFEALRSVVFPAILEGRSESLPLRIWVPGCSTGEEAYSVAICLLEVLGERAETTPIKLFATDLSEVVLAKARAGVYGLHVASEVSPERLRRFFVPAGEGYQISKQVRDLCVFARQDATRDPPFSNLDLISCRNVLIYLGPVLQAQVLPVFHYALRDGGFLMMGKSETVGAARDLFKPVDARHGIHVRRDVPSRPRFGGVGVRREAEPRAVVQRSQRMASAREIQRSADRLLLARTPAGVLVDDSMSILQFRGHTGPYLAPAAGTPTHDLVKMAREGLLPDLRTAIDEAGRQDAPVRKEGLRVKSNGHWREVCVEVLPVHSPGTTKPCFLVLFEEPGASPAAGAVDLSSGEPGQAPTPAGEAKAPSKGGAPPSDSERVVRLEREILAAREQLQAVIEEHEASTEEIETANEEILSSNEELQSTNEELQTAKEELQATNEELMTVNEEMQRRNAEATRLTEDLTNLLTSTTLPIVMLDRELRVRRFTPSAGRHLNLLAADIGRPITDLNPKLHVPELEASLKEVLNTLGVVEREVEDHEGRWHRLEIRPYRTMDDRIDGAVMSLADIDDMKRSEQRLEEARDFAENIVMTLREPLVVLDETLHVKTTNAAFQQAFGVPAGELEGRRICGGSNGFWKAEELEKRLDELVATDAALENLETELDLPTCGQRVLLFNARRVKGTGDGGPLILLSVEDVTERRQEQAANRLLEDKMRETQKLESLRVLAGGIAHDFNNILTGILGHCNLAQLDTPTSSSAGLHLTQIDEAVHRASELCRQMLAYSGRGHFVVAPCDLSALVRDAVRLVQLAIGRNVVLRFELAKDLPAVLADATQISQLVMNLVLNASEAIGNEGGLVTVTTGLMHADEEYIAGAALSPPIDAGEYVFLNVADEGTGMNDETKARIFDPFFTTKFAGRGLGLAAVLGIVRGHGGALRVDSEPGKGTSFRLLLPVSELPAVAPSASDEEAALWRGHGDILVVDDEAAVRRVASTLLESIGFHVVQASNGFEALTEFGTRGGEFRLVLLDLTMPQLSGEETFTELRKVRDDVHVLLMSGYSEQDALKHFQHGGLAGFLRKPFGLKDLRNAVRAALAES